MKINAVVAALAIVSAHCCSAVRADDVVKVDAPDALWTCRKTSEGHVIDFKNKKGLLKREGKPDVLLPSALAHVSVFYKPTGKTYTFDLGPTGTLSVALGGVMPGFPKRFADSDVYAAVDIPAPFDLAVTADRPSQRIVSNRFLDKFMIKTVPCEMYTRGWILCAVDDDPAKERAFSVRITRWVDDREWSYTGRGATATFRSTVDFDSAKKEKVGEVVLGGKKVPLWLVEFPIDLGDIQDVVQSDERGNFLHQIGRYLDFEVCSPLLDRVSGLRDETMNTNPERVSALTFYGARLEKPAASFSMNWQTPGNIFGVHDAMETLVDLRVCRPGEYVLSWDIVDGDDEKVVRTGKRVFSSAQTYRLPLKWLKTGWYALDWKLTDAEGTVLMTHKASFAVLAKDTRQSGKGEGPYAMWSVNAHYRIPADYSVYSAELLHKAGIRRLSTGLAGPFRDLDFRAKWKIDPALLSGHFHREYEAVFTGKKTEEQLVAELRKRLEESPNANVCQIFWESSPDAYMQAPEVTGGKFNPATDALKGAEKRVPLCLAAAKFLRKHFPEVKISIGQSICCTELIAEQIRGGLGDKDIDYMGLEHVGRANLPERPNSASVQTADIFRELAERMGRPSWRPGCGIETNYRRDTFLGMERQAQFYVRDAILANCWKFPVFNIGELCDAGNQYCETAWGNDSLCIRYPFLYPKKSYVGVAVLTRVFDCVTDVKILPTGDDCVYAVAATRRDGKTAYAFWTSYGSADLDLEVSGEATHVSFFGRESPLKAAGGKCRVKASGRVNYIVGGKDAVAAVRVVKVSHADAKKPADYKKLVSFDDASRWKLVTDKVEGVYGDLGLPFPTCRQPAKAPTFSVVKDEELGNCIELDLGEGDLSLPKAVSEYAVLELKEPVVIAGAPQSLGAVVKGNSGWGRLYWILEGADGVRTVSSGHKGWKEDFDDPGKMSIGFTGWRFLHYPVDEKSSIRDYSINLAGDLWSEGAVKYPAKFVGVAFAAESRPLFLSERRAKKQKIRISEIGFFD